MNKKEFLNLLDNKLFYLVDSARTKEIENYSNLIDNYLKMGQTEESAISSLGEVDDLVTAIYLSHGLDYKKLYSGKISGNGIKSAFKNFYMTITGQDKKKASGALIYFLYLIVLIVFLKVAFILVRDTASSLFGEMIKNDTVYKIYTMTFEVLYIVVAILLFFKMFTKRFNKTM